jgi:hypothetical protein
MILSARFPVSSAACLATRTENGIRPYDTWLALGFTVAYIKGLRDYCEAMKRGPNRKAIVDIGLKYTTLKDPALYDQIEWSYMDPNADIPRAGGMT